MSSMRAFRLVLAVVIAVRVLRAVEDSSVTRPAWSPRP